MPSITDPYPALVSFQLALDSGEIFLTASRVTPGLYSYADNPTGTEPRMTFVHLNGSTVSALVSLIQAKPYEGMPCYAVACAVPPKYRRQGRAKKLLAAVVHDMRAMRRDGIGPKALFIEAVVSQSNLASQKVAEHVLGPKVSSGREGLSDEPIYQYFLKL